MSQTDAGRRGVPTRHQLEALRRVLGALGVGAAKTALEASYLRMPTGGLLSNRDLLAAERTLVQSGLVLEHGGLLAPSNKAVALLDLPNDSFAELMVLALLESSPPLWLGPASGTGEIRDEFIPEEEDDRFGGLGLSPDERDALLLAAGRKFAPSNGMEVGATGELAVVHTYRTLLAANGKESLLEKVVHVSLISDQLGYDIKAPDGHGGVHRLEVKTCSTSAGDFVIYLSRNEADTGKRDPTWHVVICRYSDGHAEVIGWVPFVSLAPRLPADPASGGQWVTAQLRFELREITPGLPIRIGDGA